MAQGRPNVRSLSSVLSRGAIALMVAAAAVVAAVLVLLRGTFSPAPSASGTGPFDVNGVYRMQYTLVGSPLTPGDEHANCLVRLDQVVGTVTGRAFCYIVTKPDPATPGPTPAPPKPPPPPFAVVSFPNLVPLTGQKDQITGEVKLFFFLDCLGPIDVDGVPTALRITLTFAANKEQGLLGDGSATVRLDQTKPLDCEDGADTTQPVTVTNLANDHNEDGDGCPTNRELDANAAVGGLRDPWNPWDFFDPTSPGAGPPDRYIDLPNDILGVILRYSAAGGVYDANYDRGSSIGPNAWNRNGPDGTIDLPNDILGIILQYQHDCR